jgi:16S rRNA (guanine527-N7)-methyltransferase
MSVPDNDGATGSLREVLLAAREAGFLGPGPIERHLLHAQGFVDIARRQPEVTDSPRLLDLGSGGGLPGLVVAEQWPVATLVLLDANRRRTSFLERAVISLGLQDRVSVVQQRAEVAGQDPAFRATFDGIVVRSFGAPAVVAECAAPLLRKGGWLIVSEPPAGETESPPPRGHHRVHGEEAIPGAMSQGPARWPAGPLAQFGLTPIEFVRDGFGYEVLHQIELCPEGFPRRDGVPNRKPLF